MMHLITDQTWIVLFGGLAISATLAFLWLQSGQRHTGLVAATVALLAFILSAYGFQVRSDREQILDVIDAASKALADNQYETVYSYLHPNATEGVAHAKSELPRYKFQEARVTGIKSIDVNNKNTPPTALVNCNVLVKVVYEGQAIPVRRFVKLYFMKHDDQWLVRDYEHFDIATGFKEQPDGEPSPMQYLDQYPGLKK